jgi:predicted N-acetyltransferase YhbS
MTIGLTFRRLTPDDARLLAQIDRSETVSHVYSIRDGELHAEKLRPEDTRRKIPGWSSELIDENPTYHLDYRVERLRSQMADGCTAIGAFDAGALVGYIALRPRLTETTAQVAELFVSRSHRRTRIGTRLMLRMCDEARQAGASQLYVSAIPTESAINFYLSQGFRLNPNPHPELLALEPDDIHMIKDLKAEPPSDVP